MWNDNKLELDKLQYLNKFHIAMFSLAFCIQSTFNCPNCSGFGPHIVDLEAVKV